MSAAQRSRYLSRAAACALLLSLALSACPGAVAADDQFLQVRSYNPFSKIYGRPEFFAGRMDEPGASRVRGALSVVSFSEMLYLSF